MRVAALLACLAVVAAPVATAYAMGVHEVSTSLAKSKDGASELFRDDAFGPEGGGSIAYRVTGNDVRTFVVSSNFSPGDGTEPQSVSESACRGRLADLKTLLDRRGFKAIDVHPGVCASKDRTGAVTVP